MMMLEDWIWQKKQLEVFTPDENFSRLQPFLQEHRAWVENHFTIVTVAGTNGKGETCYILTELFKRAGRTCYTWTSPHVVEITERIKKNGVDIAPELMQSLFLRVEEKEKKLDVSLSFYEFLFVVLIEFLLLEANEKNAVLILEVGLGGRLDAVNFFSAHFAMVTSIARDHQDYLGNKLSLILFEKLAVSRKNHLLITNLESAYLRHLTKNWCAERGVLWRDLRNEGLIDKECSFQRQNALMAMEIFKVMQGIDQMVEIPSFAPFKGRGEEMSIEGRHLYYFGSHNVDGVRKLVQAKKKWQGVIWAAFSHRRKNEIAAMIKLLLSLLGSDGILVLCEFPHQRAWNRHSDWPELKHTLQQEYHEDRNDLRWKIQFGFPSVADYPEGTKILVCGSYFFVGHVQKQLSMGRRGL